MPLPLRHYEVLEDLAVRIGISDGSYDAMSRERILDPLAEIAGDRNAEADTRLLAKTLEAMFFAKESGAALRSYYNVGGHQVLNAAAERPVTPIQMLAASTHGKVLHSMAGLDDPYDAFQSDQYRSYAIIAHSKVPPDAEASEPIALPFPVPANGRLTETNEDDLTEVPGEARKVWLRITVVRNHRYLMSLNTSRASRLVPVARATRDDMESVEGLLRAAEGEREGWRSRRVYNPHAICNVAWWSVALEGLKSLIGKFGKTDFEKLVRDEFLQSDLLDKVPRHKRLLWTSGAYALLVACSDDGSQRLRDTDAALRAAGELISLTQGRAAKSLRNDAHFVLASARSEGFRDSLARMLARPVGLSAWASGNSAPEPSPRERRANLSESARSRQSIGARRAEVLRLNHEGFIQEEIAEKMGVHQSAVCRDLKALEIAGETVLKGDTRSRPHFMSNDVLNARPRLHKGVLRARTSRKPTEGG